MQTHQAWPDALPCTGDADRTQNKGDEDAQHPSMKTKKACVTATAQLGLCLEKPAVHFGATRVSGVK